MLPIIFSHYGYSEYLECTLACASETNPGARLIFLGDDDNVEVAERYGWEHHKLSNYHSEIHSEFNVLFRHVQGRKHNHIKNGKDWLRYVFERWFFIEAFLKKNDVTRFWHFDSDTMILRNLSQYENELVGIDFSVQCNGTCLNGIIQAVVVTEFCDHINLLFSNDKYLASQQLEFDSDSPRYAFTEMRAFDHFKLFTKRPWIKLMNYFSGEVFDDCICQKHAFNMCRLRSGEIVKDVFSMNGSIYGLQDGLQVRFITLNLSWVPQYVFQWVLNGLKNNNKLRLKDDYCGPFLFIRGRLKILKFYFYN